MATADDERSEDAFSEGIEQVDPRDAPACGVVDIDAGECGGATRREGDRFRLWTSAEAAGGQHSTDDDHEDADRLHEPGIGLRAGDGLERADADQRPDAGEDVVAALGDEREALEAAIDARVQFEASRGLALADRFFAAAVAAPFGPFDFDVLGDDGKVVPEDEFAAEPA